MTFRCPKIKSDPGLVKGVKGVRLGFWKSKKSNLTPLLVLVVLSGCQPDTGSEQAGTEGAVTNELVIRDLITETAPFKLIWPDDRDLIQAGIPREAELAAAILSQKLIDQRKIDEEVRRFRNSLIVKRHLARHIKKNVTADSVRQYYEDNKGSYATRYYVADIIHLPSVVTEEDYEHEEKRKLLQEVITSLITGTSFEELKGKYSESGILFQSGEYRDSDLVPDLIENLKKMAVNDSVGPIDTTDGFYILHLTAINEETPSYESVMKSIWYEQVEKVKENETQRLLSLGGG